MLFNSNYPSAAVDILHNVIVKKTVALVADNNIRFAKLFACFGGSLRHTARQNNNAVGMLFFKSADSLSCFAVAFGSNGAGIYNLNIGRLGMVGNYKPVAFKVLRHGL